MNLNFKCIAMRIARPAQALAILVLASGCTVAFAANSCVNPGGKSGCWPTIGGAVAAASSGDVITVWAGAYPEQVNITKSVSLVAAAGARPVINANGKSRGIFINGMATAPVAGVWNVIVSGFEVHNASFEGILVANGSNITLLNNYVHDNNKALQPFVPACPGIDSFETSEAMDCGEGIHLMAADHSSVIDNLVADNSGGILISDETGPVSSNLIRGNTVTGNAWACGITMASHPNALGGLPFGISHNVISQNESHHNGLGIPGAGAGVGIFAPFPGTSNTANVITGNELYGNGLPGVTMHNHAYSPFAPPVSLNDNVILGNHIHGNAADLGDAATDGTAGINIFSLAPVTGLVIANNQFGDEAYNITFNVPAGSLSVHFNNFNGPGTGIDNKGTGLIDATENWWNCSNGPSASCSSTVGSGITSTPFLTTPFAFSVN